MLNYSKKVNLIILLFIIGFTSFSQEKAAHSSNKMMRRSIAAPETAFLILPSKVVGSNSLVADVSYTWHIDNLKSKDELFTFIDKFKKELGIKSVSIIKQEDAEAEINFSLNQVMVLKDCLAVFAKNGISFYKEESSSVIKSCVQ